MGKRGRPRKAGKRTTGNRPSRAGIEPNIVKPNLVTAAKVEMFGNHGADAIGRAYAAGLLGEGSDAKRLLDIGRRMHVAYWCELPGGYRCALDVRLPSSGEESADRAAYVKRQNAWLNERLDVLKRMHDHRRAFDGLCIDPHPDDGPQWLDEVIWAERHGRTASAAAQAMWSKALAALKAIDL